MVFLCFQNLLWLRINNKYKQTYPLHTRNYIILEIKFLSEVFIYHQFDLFKKNPWSHKAIDNLVC